jgi:hypothetical protein
MSVPATTGCPAGLTYVPLPLKGMITPRSVVLAFVIEVAAFAAFATTDLVAMVLARLFEHQARIADKERNFAPSPMLN